MLAALLIVMLFFPLGSFAQTSSDYSAEQNNATANQNAQNENNTIYNGAQQNSNAANQNGYSQGNAVYFGTQSNAVDSLIQGAFQSGLTNSGTVYQNSQSNSQGASQNAQSYSQGNSANSSAQNSSNSSYSAYSQWLQTQNQSLNSSIKSNAQNANSGINSDLYTGQSYVGVNSGLFTAAKTANSSIASTSTCNSNIKTFGDIFTFGACVINKFLITSAVALATIYFLWGITQYVLSADSVEEREKSKEVMFWGVISLFVIISVWGIVALFRTILGI